MTSAPTDRRRLLFLTHRVPFPPDKGDRIRSWQLLKRLAVRHDVWLGCLADEPWSPETEATLRGLCADVKIAPLNSGRWWHGAVGLLTGAPLTEGLFFSPDLRRWIERATGAVDFDGLVVFCSNMAAYARLPCVRGIPLLVDLVDVDSEKWREYAERTPWPRCLLYRRESHCLQRVERELGRRATAVALTTPAELELYQRHAPDAPSHVIGNGVATDFFQRPSTEPLRGHELVFVGAMDYRPNIDGMLWFCQHVWPQVRQRVPTAVLRIVGRRPSPAVCALSRLPGVQIHADVPDVRPYLLGARVAVVPLHVARGVQNKVLEALACETPVVASPAALKGLDLVPGQDAVSADAPGEWVESIVQLLGDEAACGRLARAGRLYVERHCQWDQRLQPLDDILAQMLASSSPSVISNGVPLAVVPA